MSKFNGRMCEASSIEELIILAKRVAEKFGGCSCHEGYFCLGCAARAAVNHAAGESDPSDMK